jgi:hypothetical protein
MQWLRETYNGNGFELPQSWTQYMIPVYQYARNSRALMICRYVPETGILTLLYHTDEGCSRPAVRRRLANQTAMGPLLDIAEADQDNHN